MEALKLHREERNQIYYQFAYNALDTLNERYGDEVAVTAAYLEDVQIATKGSAKEQVKAFSDGLGN